MINRLIFPCAFSLNMFSMTALLIALGFFRKAEMAAEVGIIQAAMLMVFMAFATNARNIILGRIPGITVYQLFRFRVILVFPLLLLAYFFSNQIINLPHTMVFCLALRRSFEWISELQISERETEKDHKYAFLYTGIQATGFLALIAAVASGVDKFFYITLLLWACTPGFQLWPFIIRMCSCEKNVELHWKAFLPHIGSSWVIATTTYVFRILIVLLAGKVVGGILFSAFAIGGVINSVYTYALGPSLAARYGESDRGKEKLLTSLVVFALLMAGGLLAVFSFLAEKNISIESNYYPITIGLSLIGGGIMLLAQRERIHILQIDKNGVFTPDLLANTLIIITVPLTFYLLGVNGLPALFLWNSIITFIVYYRHRGSSQVEGA